MKLHVGCGAVYLRDWVNVDLPLPHVFLARDRQDLVEKFITDEDQYYGRHSDKNENTTRKVGSPQETVCDVFGSFAFIPAKSGSVDSILSRQVFEHLDRTEAKQALRGCFDALKPGGILRLDVPDPDATLRKYRDTGDEFYFRHLFGPRRDLYGFHTHYTRGMLTELVESHGFTLEGEEENIHFYPSFSLRFQKA